MKIYTPMPLIALLALSAPAVLAQQTPNMPEMQKRFEQMDKKMEDARKSKGDMRQQHMHEHMQMMHEQMQAMHGMMDESMPGKRMGPSGQMGRGPHRHGGQTVPGGNKWMQHMQDRVDMMQRMMEQMQKQHELMLKGEDKK